MDRVAKDLKRNYRMSFKNAAVALTAADGLHQLLEAAGLGLGRSRARLGWHACVRLLRASLLGKILVAVLELGLS